MSRLRAVRHPGDADKKTLVTSVRGGGALLGASVWDRVRNVAVYVRGDDLERVGRELLALAEERRRQ